MSKLKETIIASLIAFPVGMLMAVVYLIGTGDLLK